MEHQNRLTEGKIGPTLLRFALPFLLSSFLQALYGAVDLFVVGRFADSAAVSAVAIGSQVMQTLTGIILGLSMGATVLIGRRIGEKDSEGAAKAVGTSTVLFAVLAAVLTPLMLLFTNQAVSLMETPTAAVEPARGYIFTCSAGLLFIAGYNAVSGIFRGMGDSRTPVLFISLACAVNIAGDFLLTGWLGMGAEGAAIATVAAQAISFFASLGYMAKKGLAFPVHKSHFRPDGRAIKSILKIGFPLALQDGLVSISFLVITAIINTMGLVASASVGVVERVIGFAMLPPSAFASAVATMTAQNVGAKRPDRARKALWFGIGYSLIFGVLVCVYAQFLPETVTSIFTRDSAVIASAADYFRSYALDCVLVSFVFCMNSYFSGCGNSLVSFLHSMVATFGVRIPLTYLLSRGAEGNLYPMGLAAPAATVVSLIICLCYLRWENRRQKQLAL